MINELFPIIHSFVARARPQELQPLPVLPFPELEIPYLPLFTFEMPPRRLPPEEITSLSLSTARAFVLRQGGETVGNYALFAGGVNVQLSLGNQLRREVDAFSSSLVRTILEPVAVSGTKRSVSTGKYAYFHGWSTDMGVGGASVYDESLQASHHDFYYGEFGVAINNFALFSTVLESDTMRNYYIAPYLNVIKLSPIHVFSSSAHWQAPMVGFTGATKAGNHAIFTLGGGFGETRIDVNVTLNEFLQFNVLSLAHIGYAPTAAIGDYAILSSTVGAGIVSSGRNIFSVVNNALQVLTPIENTVGSYGTATATKKSAIFFGNPSVDFVHNDATAINNHLKKSIIKTTSPATHTMAAATAGNHALFAGGRIQSPIPPFTNVLTTARVTVFRDR